MLKNVKTICYFWHNKCIDLNVILINLFLEESHLHIACIPFFRIFVFMRGRKIYFIF
jgi:hypothetical protein